MHKYIFSPPWHNSPQWARASSFLWLLDHKQRRITACRTPLDEWSARRKDYLTKHNSHNRQIFILSSRFRTYSLQKSGRRQSGSPCNWQSCLSAWCLAPFVRWRIDEWRV